MKNILVALTIIVAVLSTNCGSADEKFFGMTPEEFMQRYNANLDKCVPNAELRKNLKLHGFEPVSMNGKKLGVSFKTSQKYLAMEILHGKVDILAVHLPLSDEIVSHAINFKIMCGVGAYSIHGDADPELWRWNETAITLNKLFQAFDGGNLSPTVSHNGISYSIEPALGDFGPKLSGDSICFSARATD